MDDKCSTASHISQGTSKSTAPAGVAKCSIFSIQSVNSLLSSLIIFLTYPWQFNSCQWHLPDQPWDTKETTFLRYFPRQHFLRTVCLLLRRVCKIEQLSGFVHYTVREALAGWGTQVPTCFSHADYLIKQDWWCSFMEGSLNSVSNG